MQPKQPAKKFSLLFSKLEGKENNVAEKLSPQGNIIILVAIRLLEALVHSAKHKLLKHSRSSKLERFRNKGLKRIHIFQMPVFRQQRLLAFIDPLIE